MRKLLFMHFQSGTLLAACHSHKQLMGNADGISHQCNGSGLVKQQKFSEQRVTRSDNLSSNDRYEIDPTGQ